MVTLFNRSMGKINLGCQQRPGNTEFTPMQPEHPVPHPVNMNEEFDKRVQAVMTILVGRARTAS